MRFICTEQCELPFVLNLPDGVYQVDLNGTAYELEIGHGQFAVHAGKMFAVGLPEFLRSQFGAEFDRAYKQPLRTVARHTSTLEVQESDLPSVTDAEVSQDMVGVVQGEDPGKYAGKTDDLNKEAQRRLDSMSPEDLADFRLRVAKMRVTHRMGNPDAFLTALNTLIRRYMQQFNDFFVEEVTYHQLAAQTPLTGVFVHVVCDGELLHNHGRIGKAPPIMFRPWAIHSQPDIDQFKKDLGQGAPTNSVLLLEVRAKAFLERGATRSAIIEASAGLELCVTQKLRAGYMKQGKAATDIDAILRGEIRFNERANKLMYQATGKRVADLDTRLYQSVLTHRDKFRHGIAHADVEPTQQEAEQAIQDFEQLRKLIDGIPV